MKFKIHEKLIHEVESPKGLLYRMIIVYASVMATLIIIISCIYGDNSKLNFYFLINLSTVGLMAWFIRKSFNIDLDRTFLCTFRVSLFLLLNSSLASMAGGLDLINRDTASLLAAIIYAPAMLIIVFSFKNFISYVNHNYKYAVNLSLTDELTGLPNRRHLNIILREMENRTCTICIADIDHFKKINDTYGHEAGDRVLRNAGLRLSSLSSDDVFISRSGGEEFAIIIFNIVNADKIIKKIKKSASDGSNGSMNVTFSIGVAHKQKYDSSSSVINAADDALYNAKRAGRDRIIYAQPLRNN